MPFNEGMQEKALRAGAGTMSTASKIPLSPRAQAWYDDLMEQLDTVEERVPANIAKIKGTLGIYEQIYDMSTEEMREKLAAGEIEETDDICTWSQLITVLEMILSDRD
jgi:hypothetical protein